MSIHSTALETNFEVHVSKDTFKFNAAHFVAYPGFRERLHGHNYRVAVNLLGSRKIGPDGYLIDFGCVKGVTKKVCKDLNEHFLCPTLSTVVTIDVGAPSEESVTLTCEDGSVFVFPISDCAMLPIAHATTEELAIYLWGKILEGLDADYLCKRGIHTMEVNVSESAGQDATFRMQIATGDAGGEQNVKSLFDVASYIAGGDVVPRPCPASQGTHSMHGHVQSAPCGPACREQTISKSLKILAELINNGTVGGPSQREVTGKDLEALLGDSTS